MIESAVSAIFLLFEPARILSLFIGVIMGLGLGVIPGLGGLVGLSFLLPFTFYMDPVTAIAFLMGLSSVTATSDTIPAVLFGIPGTVASAATTLDGYPLAQKGQAGRALGAAFSASILGGLFGAVLLGISVPILQPVMHYIASPELLAICIFGLSLVAILSGDSPLKGLVAVCLGIILSATGIDSTGQLRWTFDVLYLYDGFHIFPVILGLFALPEIADLVIQRTSVQKNIIDNTSTKTQWIGIKDTFRNWFLVLRCSCIGSGLGAVPGIGAAILDWIAYGHAARTEKGAEETFGKGDIRGVIASESANNAKEGGALVPTLIFGIPGSASMAIILGALLMHGIVPGPQMLSVHLDITYAMVWSIALANIFGAGICFLFSKQLSKIATIRIGILAPIIMCFIFLGAFQGSNEWGNIYSLLSFGILGFIMKRLKWPRPPLVLGFILGALIERYLFISFSAYGWAWLLRPAVIIILSITAYGILKPIWKLLWYKKQKVLWGFQKANLNLDLFFMILAGLVFAIVLILSHGWVLQSRLLPETIGIAGLGFSFLLVACHLFISQTKVKTRHMDLVADFGNLSGKQIYSRGFVFLCWCFFYILVAQIIGMLPAFFVYLLMYLMFHGKEKWKISILISLLTWLVIFIFFQKILMIPWPSSLINFF